MALVGNCSWIVTSNHPTETETSTITLPDGTSFVETFPKQVQTVTEYKDVYLCIKQVDNINHWDGINSHKHILFQFAAYKDTATRNADAENFLFWSTDSLSNYDPDSGLYSQIYAQLKTREGFTELIDD